jgi:muramidase (phage lysozyme)
MTNLLLSAAVLLSALAHQETCGELDPYAAIGDGGKAAGRYQMHAGAVADVNRRFDPVTPYTLADRHDPLRGDLLAIGYALILNEQAQRTISRQLTQDEMLAVWRRGFRGWQKSRLHKSGRRAKHGGERRMKE